MYMDNRVVIAGRRVWVGGGRGPEGLNGDGKKNKI